MWGALMVAAVITAFHPVRLAIVALLISRPRPVTNLFAYWIGAISLGLPSVLIPLMVLHSTPVIESFTRNVATSSSLRYVQVGLGVLVLSIAALMAARSVPRQKVNSTEPGSNVSTMVLEPDTPQGLSDWLGHREGSTTSAKSATRGLSGRANRAWENGSLWVSALLGGLMGGPSLDGAFFGLALIVTSGATVAAQVTAAIAYVFVILLVVEIILICAIAAPSKTQAVLHVVHTWVQRHRRKILIVLFSVVGLVMIAQGTNVL